MPPTSPWILDECETQLLALLQPLVGPAPAPLREVLIFDVFGDKTLAEAIQATRAIMPAAFLSQPALTLASGDTNLPAYRVNWLLGATVKGRRTRHDRLIRSGGLYEVWQSLHVALHGKQIDLTGLTHPGYSAPLQIEAVDFAADKDASIVLLNVIALLRAELLSGEYR